MAATMNGGAWSHAVPLDETDGNARSLPQRARADTSQTSAYASDRDSKGVQKRSSAWDLMSDSETTKQRRTSLRATNTTATRKRSRNHLRDKRAPEEKLPSVDDSAWIHRDKLAQIEIQEMAAAGIHVPPSQRPESTGLGDRKDGRASRSRSRSRAASRASEEYREEIATDEDYAAAYPGYDESPHKRISTIPAAPEEEAEAEAEMYRRARQQSSLKQHSQSQSDLHEEQENEYENSAPPLPKPQRVSEFDPYRDSHYGAPEDFAEQTHRHQHVSRPSTSRIPVSRVSPAPVPSNMVDRDSPLPRSRAGSQNWNGSFDEMQHARKTRSGSTGSAILLEHGPEGPRVSPPGSSNKTSTTEENSPPKSRVTKKTGGKPSTRGTGRPRSSRGNKREPSETRSGSAAGHQNRPPSTDYGPDSEPPWLTSMYKPDPRLPPDQQILPTHARRMMQEQWEKEGKSGTLYDQNFNLPNDEQFRPAPVLSVDGQSGGLPVARSPSPMKDEQTSPSPPTTGQNLPLSPISPMKSNGHCDEATSPRPGTSGGYKITPTIPATPTLHRSPLPSPGGRNSSAAPEMYHPIPRIPDMDEKAEAAPKKGCCCIVM